MKLSNPFTHGACWTALVWLTLPCLGAQQAPAGLTVPTVSFDLVLPGSAPPHYTISVQMDGTAIYREQDEPPEGGETPPDPYVRKFVMSQASRDRIFAIARQLDYFQGDFDYKKGRLANMGAKTLAYVDAQRYHQTRYNWSSNTTVQEITDLFQGMAETLEFGRKLTYLYRYDKLGLNEVLQRMIETSKDQNLPEAQVNETILKTIREDTSVINIARSRAEYLLSRIRKDASAAAESSDSSPGKANR